MKKFFVMLTFIVLSQYVYTQSFNVSMGASMSFQDRSVDLGMGVKPILGFNAQFGRDYRLWRSLVFRVEAGFLQMGIKYDKPVYMEFFSYTQVGTYILYKSIHSPFYVGMGGFGDYLMAVSSFNGQEASKLNRRNYDYYDYGIEPIIGSSLDFDFIGYFLEIRLHYGLNNIDIANNEVIRNLGLNFCFGVSFKIH